MKQKLFTAIFACAVIFGANAQSFTNFAVGVDAGSYGGGLWAATNLSPNFILKGGFDYISVGWNKDVVTEMNAYKRNSPSESISNVRVNFGKPKLQIPQGKLLVEYYPAENGIFSLSLGAFIGNFDFVVDGHIENYAKLKEENDSELSFKTFDVELNPHTDGTFDGRLRLGNVVKPYFGIGLGRTIASNNRIGFKFDLGAAYQGMPKLISTCASVDNLGNAINSEEAPEGMEIMTTIAKYGKVWPVLNFSLSYRF